MFSAPAPGLYFTQISLVMRGWLRSSASAVFFYYARVWKHKLKTQSGYIFFSTKIMVFGKILTFWKSYSENNNQTKGQFSICCLFWVCKMVFYSKNKNTHFVMIFCNQGFCTFWRIFTIQTFWARANFGTFSRSG